LPRKSPGVVAIKETIFIRALITLIHKTRLLSLREKMPTTSTQPNCQRSRRLTPPSAPVDRSHAPQVRGRVAFHNPSHTQERRLHPPVPRSETPNLAIAPHVVNPVRDSKKKKLKPPLNLNLRPLSPHRSPRSKYKYFAPADQPPCLTPRRSRPDAVATYPKKNATPPVPVRPRSAAGDRVPAHRPRRNRPCQPSPVRLYC